MCFTRSNGFCDYSGKKENAEMLSENTANKINILKEQLPAKCLLYSLTQRHKNVLSK